MSVTTAEFSYCRMVEMARFFQLFGVPEAT